MVRVKTASPDTKSGNRHKRHREVCPIRKSWGSSSSVILSWKAMQGIKSTSTLPVEIEFMSNMWHHLIYLAFVITPWVENAPYIKGPLIWQDEFDYFNTTTWTHMITAWRGGNGAFQFYTDSPVNSFVENGILHIKPTLTADTYGEDALYGASGPICLEGCNANYTGNDCCMTYGTDIINPIQSARISSRYHFDFLYGIVEVRAQLPQGDWLWPAIWLLPTDSLYGKSPRSGEIDLIEARGNLNLKGWGVSQGVQRTASTLHWGPDPSNNRYKLTRWEKELNGTDFAADYHLFSFVWTETDMTFYVDDEEIGNVTPPAGGFWELGHFSSLGIDNIWANGSIMAPFDQRFYFVLNVAAGGSYFSDGMINTPCTKPWKSTDPDPMKKFWEQHDCWYPTWNANTSQPALKLDYIRVYKLP